MRRTYRLLLVLSRSPGNDGDAGDRAERHDSKQHDYQQR
jgi:hypothetical protein